jgi:uncharacterized protein involved in exopolysaccharide biosynthesis
LVSRRTRVSSGCPDTFHDRESPGDAVTLHDYLRVVRRRWWILVAAALLATAGAVGYSLHQQKLYSASAQVLLNSQNLAAEISNVTVPNVDPARVAQTQAGVARVPTVAIRALRTIHVRNRTAISSSAARQCRPAQPPTF